MRYNKTLNTKRNLAFGAINQILSIALQYILRIVIIRFLGVLYLGLNSLFTSVLGMLSLAEMGFSTAVVYSLYKPIAENDTKKIRETLAFFKKVYSIIGIIITVLGISLIPFLRFLIKGDTPNGINIYVIYLFSLASTSCSYFLYAYRNSIITAFQRGDLISKVNSLILIAKNIVQITVIILFKNYYLYIVFGPIFTIITNLFIKRITDRHFPECQPEGDLPETERKSIIDNVKSLFIYKIGSVIAGYADNVVISSFLGLAVLAEFHNYYSIITSLFGVLSLIYSSIIGGFGNSIASEGKDKNLELFFKMFWLQSIIVGWMSACLLSLFQPFIRLSYGQEHLLSSGIVICIVLLFYFWKINDINHIFKEAAGLWKYDRFRPFVSAVVNFSVNIITVQYIGLYGVIISSLIIEITISLFWGCRVIFKYYFCIPFREYISKYLLYTAINCLIGFATYFACYCIDDTDVFSFFGKGLLCLIVPSVLYTAVYLLLGRKDYIVFFAKRLIPRHYLKK